VKRWTGLYFTGLITPLTVQWATRVFCLLLLVAVLWFAPAQRGWARSVVTPWAAPGIEEMGLQNLVYGSSSFHDVELVLGPPDDVVSGQLMYPVIVNYYYYEKNPDETIEEMANKKGKAATVCIFENNLLVGLQYKTRSDQLVDLTYFLQNNNDYAMINNPIRQSGYYGYFNNPQFYQVPLGRAW
jgi:hypothetical protein